MDGQLGQVDINMPLPQNMPYGQPVQSMPQNPVYPRQPVQNSPQPQVYPRQPVQNMPQPQPGVVYPQGQGFVYPQGAYAAPAWQQPAAAVKKSSAAAIALAAVLMVLFLAAAVLMIATFAGRKEIILSKSRLRLSVDETQGVRVENFDEDLSNIHLEYESADPDVARISNEFDDGFYVEGVSKGSTTITVRGRGCKEVEMDVKVVE